MTDQDKREVSGVDAEQHEQVEQGMQGADGNVDANGLDPDPAKRQEKLAELTENIGGES